MNHSSFKPMGWNGPSHYITLREMFSNMLVRYITNDKPELCWYIFIQIKHQQLFLYTKNSLQSKFLSHGQNLVENEFGQMWCSCWLVT